jgi:hypothetical protein
LPAWVRKSMHVPTNFHCVRAEPVEARVVVSLATRSGRTEKLESQEILH